MITITIINPFPGKGLEGRKLVASHEIKDESNYIEIGAIVRNDGSVDRTKTMTIEATDQSQNKTLIGTGVAKKIHNGEKLVETPYYPFHYEFKTAGQHTITFACEGVSESVVLEVS